MARAGYEGTELGPPGYLGDGDELRARFERHGLALTGGCIPVRFSEPQHCDEDLRVLRETLDLFDAAGGDGREGCLRRRRLAASARSPAACVGPSIGLDDAGWPRLAEGVPRAAEVARAAASSRRSTLTRGRSSKRPGRSSACSS